MGDQWVARVSAMENTQEKLEHNIREMEGQLAKLTSLFEDMAVHPRSSSPLPHQWVPRSFVQTTSHLPRKTDCPNLRKPKPTAPPAFMATPRPVDWLNGSKSRPSGQKTNKDKTQWDPIPITYTKLFPKLVRNGHIEPFQFPPFMPPFPR